MQPDLGTALVFGAILFPMLYWAGLNTLKLLAVMCIGCSAILTAPFIPFFSPSVWLFFMFGLLAFLFYRRYSFTVITIVLSLNILIGVAIPVVFNKLEPYQQKRVTTIFNPEADPLGAGYQIISSKIAIGSGGFLGKGIGKGRFTELGFLPHAHTDFVFSVVGEQLGFVGGFTVLLLFLFIVYRGIMIGYRNDDPFMSVTAIGIAVVFAFHTFVNIGMVLGIMPVTGIPIPFLSYGGSSCIANATLVGILLNFNLHRHAL
jgi:rod shape determining protein RodA